MQSQVNVNGVDVRIEGRLIRIARLEREKYEVLTEPASVLDGLRNSGVRVDLFTFIQSLPETQPQYTYPMEWDNLAVLPVTRLPKIVAISGTRNPSVLKGENTTIATQQNTKYEIGRAHV